MNRTRVCHGCGGELTLKGVPLEGNYCGPICLDRARNRKFKEDSDERADRLRKERGDDESFSMSNIHNPFEKLFDSYED
jgi:hypothetical protein